MKAKKFSEALGNVSDEYVSEAIAYQSKRKNRSWLKWTAMAACLCLIVAGSTVFLQQSFKTPDAGDEGGEVSGAGNYSVAVYPASEDVKDVASSEVISMTESEAMSHLLAEYLPTQLPDGFHYGRGSIYNTVMKDGTQYNMLRIEYITGTIPEQQYSDDGGAIVPDPDVFGDFFTVCVWNFEPDTKAGITPVEEVTETLLEENGSIYIQSGECYVGVFMETAEPTTILEVIKNIE